jgi:hypothetical protein
MKNLIILIALVVAGYFAYQHFGLPWLEDNNSAKPTFNMYSLPEKCQGAGERFKDALNRQDEMVTAVSNSYSTNFRRCLREAGYTRTEIDETYDALKDSR